MSIKSWLLHKVHGLTTRVDLPRNAVLRSPVLGTTGESPPAVGRSARRSAGVPHIPSEPVVPHLGPYAPLIAAIRDELQGFVVSHLRLHLAIAERDRYLLTSIDVKGIGPAEDDLLRRFIQEFKPEQIKHYFAKEVIGALPNAAAIDLSQFAGLNARDDADREDDDYGELLAELRSGKPGSSLRPYEVSLVGRWSEAGPAAGASQLAAPATPLAGRTVAIEIEDAKGGRRTYLHSVAAGAPLRDRQGRGLRCRGGRRLREPPPLRNLARSWRVVGHRRRIDQRRPRRARREGARAQHLPARLGGSGRGPRGGQRRAHRPLGARGRECRRLSARGDRRRTRCGRAVHAHRRGRWARSRHRRRRSSRNRRTPASGRSRRRWSPAPAPSSFRPTALPFAIGRSRRQALVIDWAHGGVSGHHLDITAIDATSVSVTVHGDNGVVIDGTSYPPGSRARWNAGESMVLGRAVGREPDCRLTLAHRPPPATSVQ